MPKETWSCHSGAASKQLARTCEIDVDTPELTHLGLLMGFFLGICGLPKITGLLKNMFKPDCFL